MSHSETRITRYWIFDRDETPQGLPLQRLLRMILTSMDAEECAILVSRCEGYGKQIHEWNAMLDCKDVIAIPVEEIDEVGAGTTEWFYNLDAECVAGDIRIRFGLHDSTALYIEAPVEIGKRIAASFENTRMDDVSDE